MKRETLTLVQSSMQFSDKAGQIREDAFRLFAKAQQIDADAIAFSETTPDGDVMPHVRAAAADAGWRLQAQIRGDARFAVSPKNHVTESGYVHVLDPQGGNRGYSWRGLAEVTFRTPAGNVVSCHSTHWLTGYKLDARPGPEDRRELLFDRQTQAMIERVQLHGQGRRLSFWQGDTNVDAEKDQGRDRDALHAQLRAAGLLSIWDELDTYPSTHGGKAGGTLDQIGHYRRDARVTAASVDVLPTRHSDHHAVVARYTIEPLAVVK